MREYALLTLNMIKYADIDLKNQSAEYARILDVSDAVHNIRSQYKLLSSHRGRDLFRTHCQTFKMKCFTKRTMPECRCATRSFPEHGRRVCGTRALQ